MRFTTAGTALALAVLFAAAGAAAQTGPGPEDQQFVDQAIRANNAEIAQAQAEMQSSTDPNVKTFAGTVMKDHTAANTQLVAIASSLNMTYPPPADANGASATTAAAPDARDYMSQQVQAHQAAVGLYQGEVNNGGSAQLRTYAATALLTIKAHLSMAQQYLTTGTVTPESTPAPPGR